MADDKFSLLKFLGSFFQWLPWIKTLRFGLGLVIVAFVGFTVYKAFFVRTQQQTQKIVVEKGATAIIQQKQELPRRRFIPFVEGFVEQRSQNTMQSGIRAGLRFEW